MAFNGTTHLPENEMIATLQRYGLGFGSDTNAITSFNETVYKLDVPSATDESLDVALNIMREQVSEALMASKDIDEERGVIAGEQRTRDVPGYRTEVARLKLVSGWLGSRLPIGSLDVIRTAGRDRFVDFYRTYYRPSRATLVAVGDFDIDAMERRVRARFGDWAPAAPDAPDPAPPPVASRGIETKIIVEPGSPSTVELIWTRAADLRPDSVARQYDHASAYVGISSLNQRLREIANGDAPPFVSALATKDDLYRTVDVTSVKVTFLPGRLSEAITAVEREQRRLVAHGITSAELERIIDDGRSYMRRGVAGAATQSTPQLANEMAAQVNNREVPVSWPDRQALFERQVKAMTTASVTRSIRDAFQGAGPLILVTTPVPLPGGEAAVSRELAAARRLPTPAPLPPEVRTWPYTSFGTPGTVVGRRDIPEIGTTVVTFANGTLLTVKPTRFADKEVAVTVTTGLGQLGMARDRMDPLYGAQDYLVKGGLGKLTSDQVGRVLAGRSVGAEASVEQNRYKWKGATQTDELTTELQLLAAYVTDPGLRPAPLEREKSTMATTLETLRATPYGAWQLDSPGLLSSGDAREAIPTNAELQTLSMASAAPLMRKAIGSGPIHVTIVGDVTVDKAIAETAETFAALAPRGPAAMPPLGAYIRRFPAGRRDGPASSYRPGRPCLRGGRLARPERGQGQHRAAACPDADVRAERPDQQGDSRTPGTRLQPVRAYPVKHRLRGCRLHRRGGGGEGPRRAGLLRGDGRNRVRPPRDADHPGRA